MAVRYWVGGTGTWDASSTVNWAASSGASSGASAPTSADDVVFDNNSNVGTGAFTVTTGAGAVCRDFSTSSLDGFMTLTLTSGLSAYGSVTFPSSAFSGAGAASLTLAATSGINTLTTNGQTLGFSVACNGVGGTWQLGSALTFTTSRSVLLTNGTFDANGYNVTAFSVTGSNSNTRTLALGSGAWTIGGGVTFTTSTGLTVTGSAVISMTSASAKTFAGGGKSWPTLNNGGAGVLTITGSNTFADVTNSVQPATFRLTAGTTQTVSAFSVNGTAGNLVTIDTTTAGTIATLSKSSGTVAVNYCSIKDSTASGGATWTSINGTDAGNNTGWSFIAGTNIVPSAGTLAVTGYAPTIAQTTNQAVLPDVGSVSITGYAPAIVQPQSVLPDTGTLAITGYAPTVLQAINSAVAPGVGSVAISGYAPTIAQPQAVVPDVGIVVLTGYPPSVALTQDVAPGVGSMAITGYAPTIAQPQTVLPDVGSVSVTGYAPAIGQTITSDVSPGVGALSLTGYAPDVTQFATSPNLVPGAGSITITGYSPDITQGPATVVGGWYDEKKKKRFYVKHKDQLFVFSSRKEANAAIAGFDTDDEPKIAPVATVPLPEVEAYAEVQGKIAQYNAAYNSERYAKIVALFEQMQDEEDIETLLMAL